MRTKDLERNASPTLTMNDHSGSCELQNSNKEKLKFQRGNRIDQGNVEPASSISTKFHAQASEPVHTYTQNEKGTPWGRYHPTAIAARLHSTLALLKERLRGQNNVQDLLDHLSFGFHQLWMQRIAFSEVQLWPADISTLRGLSKEFLQTLPKMYFRELIEDHQVRPKPQQSFSPDLHHVTGHVAQQRRRAIEAIIREDFPGLRFTHRPQYSPFATTAVAQEDAGTHIGKKSFSTRQELRNSLVHEELHHRWWKRGKHGHHPRHSKEEERFYQIIQRYFRMRAW